MHIIHARISEKCPLLVWHRSHVCLLGFLCCDGQFGSIWKCTYLHPVIIVWQFYFNPSCDCWDILLKIQTNEHKQTKPWQSNTCRKTEFYGNTKSMGACLKAVVSSWNQPVTEPGMQVHIWSGTLWWYQKSLVSFLLQLVVQINKYRDRLKDNMISKNKY